MEGREAENRLPEQQNSPNDTLTRHFSRWRFPAGLGREKSVSSHNNRRMRASPRRIALDLSSFGGQEAVEGESNRN